MKENVAHIQQLFHERGISVSEWARAHGFNVALVYRVLRGASTSRGQSHAIAVTLGVKRGIVSGVQELDDQLNSIKTKQNPLRPIGEE